MTERKAYGLEKSGSFVVHIRDGYVEAVYGSYPNVGLVAYGGPENAGGVSGTSASAVMQAAINALTNGGKISVKAGTYNIATTINVNAKICLQGEMRGDDSDSGGTILNRTANVTVFSIVGNFVRIENFQFQGNYASDYITVPSAKSKLFLYDLTFLTATGKGINLNGSFFVNMKRIRGISLGDYLIYNVASHTLNLIEDITAYACNGIIRLDSGVGDKISVVGSDAFTGLTNPLIYLTSETVTLDGINLEGDATNGAPIDGIWFVNSWALLSGSRFYKMGNVADTKFPIRATDSDSVVRLSGVRFESTISYRDYVVSSALIVHDIDVKFSKGASGFLAKNSGTATGTGSQQTIAHNLAVTPNRVQLTNLDDGANPYQSANPDAANIYVTAVNGKQFLWRAWKE